MGVDVGGEGLWILEDGEGDPAVGQPEALHLPGLGGQLPEHLHGCLVQHLCEETLGGWHCWGQRETRRLLGDRERERE